MASRTVSATSIDFSEQELTPIEQWTVLAKGSTSRSFIQAAVKVTAYLANGQKLEEAVAGLFVFSDTKFLFTITNRLNEAGQSKFKGDIEKLLKRMYSIQHPQDLNSYEVVQLDVHEALDELGKQIKDTILKTFDTEEERLVFEEGDEKEMFV